MLGTILLIILIVILIGALPSWPYSSGWGYYPSGGIGLVLIIVIILLVDGPDLGDGRARHSLRAPFQLPVGRLLPERPSIGT